MRLMTGSKDVAEPQLSRWEERNARRKANSALAAEAARARGLRNKKTLVQRVEEAQKVLNGKNVAGAITTIQQVSSFDYDVYIIAERTGQNRRGVLKQFGPPRASVETAYRAEAGLGSPEHDPQGVEE